MITGLGAGFAENMSDEVASAIAEVYRKVDLNDPAVLDRIAELSVISLESSLPARTTGAGASRRARKERSIAAGRTVGLTEAEQADAALLRAAVRDARIAWVAMYGPDVPLPAALRPKEARRTPAGTTPSVGQMAPGTSRTRTGPYSAGSDWGHRSPRDDNSRSWGARGSWETDDRSGGAWSRESWGSGGSRGSAWESQRGGSQPSGSWQSWSGDQGGSRWTSGGYGRGNSWDRARADVGVTWSSCAVEERLAAIARARANLTAANLRSRQAAERTSPSSNVAGGDHEASDAQVGRASASRCDAVASASGSGSAGHSSGYGGRRSVPVPPPPPPAPPRRNPDDKRR